MSIQEKYWSEKDRIQFEYFVKEQILPIVEFENQRILTPVLLCYNILNRKKIKTLRSKKINRILIVNNVEFVWVLVQLGVDASKIRYVTDSLIKADFATKLFPKCIVERRSFLDWETNLKFDVIVGNPPFSSGTMNGGHGQWQQFVTKACNQLKDDGMLLFVSPKWHGLGARKKSSAIFLNSKGEEYIKKYTTDYSSFYTYQVEYIEIFDSIEAKKYFEEGSSFCWYIIVKTPRYKPTNVKQYLASKTYEFEHSFIEGDLLPANFTPDILDWLDKLYLHGTTSYYITQETMKQPLELKNLISDVQSEQYPYRLHRGMSDERKCFTSIKSVHYDKKKTLWSCSNAPEKAFNDQYCNQTHDFAYKIWEEEADYSENFLDFLRSQENKQLTRLFNAGRRNNRHDTIPNFDWSIPWRKQWIEPTKSQMKQIQDAISTIGRKKDEQ